MALNVLIPTLVKQLALCTKNFRLSGQTAANNEPPSFTPPQSSAATFFFRSTPVAQLSKGI